MNGALGVEAGGEHADDAEGERPYPLNPWCGKKDGDFSVTPFLGSRVTRWRAQTRRSADRRPERSCVLFTAHRVRVCLSFSPSSCLLWTHIKRGFPPKRRRKDERRQIGDTAVKRRHELRLVQQYHTSSGRSFQTTLGCPIVCTCGRRHRTSSEASVSVMSNPLVLVCM